MADLTITAANILAVDGYFPIDKKAGETLTRGAVVYTKASDDRFWLADCENASSAVAAVTGIVLNDAAAGQPVRVISNGNLGFGAILTVGMVYILSVTGKIAPITDKAIGDFLSVLGVATTTGNLMLTIINSGVEVTA